MNQQPNFDIYTGSSFVEFEKEIKSKFGTK